MTISYGFIDNVLNSFIDPDISIFLYQPVRQAYQIGFRRLRYRMEWRIGHMDPDDGCFLNIAQFFCKIRSYVPMVFFHSRDIVQQTGCIYQLQIKMMPMPVECSADATCCIRYSTTVSLDTSRRSIFF